jgi:hypothetical protein
VPAWGGAAALWQEYLAGFHAVSVGSTASAPPYLAVVAALATVLGGQAWLAVDVLLLGCVPLAGLTAYLASRWLVSAAPSRVLLAAAYALLPVATGAVAAGRLGTAVAFIFLPLIVVSGGRMLTAAPRQARRAAWATGLLIALAAAFAPLTWVLGVLFAAGALAARRWLVAVNPLNAAIVAVAPFLVLFPWSLHLLTSPSAFLSEAGLSAAGLTTPGLSPGDLLALSPGGPGIPPAWATAGFAASLLALGFSQAAPPTRRRTGLLIAGWTLAVAGLLTATVVSRVSVTVTGGARADAWPGVALALAALGLLLASAPAIEGLAQFIAGGDQPRRAAAHDTARRLLALAAFTAAATAPLFVAGYWVEAGVQGPVGGIAAPVLPAFVSASSALGGQYRTLILRPEGTGLDYTVVRQGDPALGEPELGSASAAGAALSRQVAALAAPDGADAGDPGMSLGQFGIRYVLLPGPVSSTLAQRLDAAIGLVALSKAPTYDLWQVAGPVGRVRVAAADGTTTVVPSGAVNMADSTAPAAGGTLVLAEPYGGWTATLNSRPLKPVAAPVDGWAQGFVLPPGGGRLSITRDNLAREVSLVAELIAVLAVGLLALPGKRADPAQEAEALAALREARNSKRAATAVRRAAQPAGPRLPGAARPVARARAGLRAAVHAERPGFARARPAGRDDPRRGTAASAVESAASATVTVPAAGLSPAAADAPAVLASPPRSSDTGPRAPAGLDASGTAQQPADPGLTPVPGPTGDARPAAEPRTAEPWEQVAEPWEQVADPWDTAGEWGSPARAGGQPQYRRDSGPQTPVPVGGQPASPPAAESQEGSRPMAARPAKPERHSHRAAKHGRPSRWRGNRPSGGGGS